MHALVLTRIVMVSPHCIEAFLLHIPKHLQGRAAQARWARAHGHCGADSVGPLCPPTFHALACLALACKAGREAHAVKCRAAAALAGGATPGPRLTSCDSGPLLTKSFCRTTNTAQQLTVCIACKLVTPDEYFVPVEYACLEVGDVQGWHMGSAARRGEAS